MSHAPWHPFFNSSRLVKALIMHPMVQFALRAARGAAEQFVRARERIEVARGDNDLDTFIADTARRAEAHIVRQLERGYPQHGLSGRYTDHRDGEGQGSDYHWRIEPVHGYSNLASAASGFALSVVCLFKGRAEHAVVIAPFTDEEYIVSRGRGAQHSGHRIRVTNATAIEGARLAMGLPESWQRPRHLPTYLSIVQQVGPQVEMLRTSGCALLDVLELASGRVDAVYVLGLDAGDSEIVSLFLKECGALAGSADGTPVVVAEGTLMAAGARLYKALAQTMQPHL
jgi:myo-inositol-1(or 4)-monophosphatase|tara:strand:+ start:55518 stop:56372 length:855 start_codon:yes stop_codon:yes gene_type:complete